MTSTVTAERDHERARRLEETAAQAKAAEQRGDNNAASAAWRRYSLITDGGRPADELIAEALELMRISDRIDRRPTPSAPLLLTCMGCGSPPPRSVLGLWDDCDAADPAGRPVPNTRELER